MITVTSENLYDEVFKEEKPVVILFESLWNKTSRVIMFEFKDPGITRDVYKLCTVNAHENPDLILRYSIRSVPEFVIYYRRKVLKRLNGYISPEELIREVKEAVHSHGQ